MSDLWQYRMHPFVLNHLRDQFLDECTELFGPRGERWQSGSNYDYSFKNADGHRGTFDVCLRDKDDAILFMFTYPDSVRLSMTDNTKLYKEANPHLELFEW
jgi:hypothetical protein